jgi:hypothetical protein
MRMQPFYFGINLCIFLLMADNTRSKGNSIRIKTDPNRYIVDTTTGEMTPITEVRGTHSFPGGWAFIGRTFYPKLRQAKLPADAFNLTLLLMERGGVGGICAMPYKEMAAVLGVSPSRISRLLAVLEGKLVAQRIGNRKSGTVMVNPYFHFCGSAFEQHKAIDFWCSQRPYNIIIPRQRRKI